VEDQKGRVDSLGLGVFTICQEVNKVQVVEGGQLFLIQMVVELHYRVVVHNLPLWVTGVVVEVEVDITVVGVEVVHEVEEADLDT
jgi:hypothetical protein